MVQVNIKTYGCTLNQADSDMMESLLQRSGIRITRGVGDADVLLVNTCTVKRQTAQRILDLVSELDKSGKRMVIAGCMAAANKDLLEKRAPHASILTPSNIASIADAVSAAHSGKRVVYDKYSKTDRLENFVARNDVIAHVPVSEGCLGGCSFCETRIARGPLHSFSGQRILDAIRCSAASGAKEVQLTSQDIGAYGADSGTGIVPLMRSIAALDGDFKVRVGMLNPDHLGKFLPEFANTMNDSRFYRFVHLPVQSGSDSVLAAMRRNYSVAEFERQVAALREAIPGVAIETDVIVGFPGETESDFDQSVDLVKRVKPEVTNISKFSARPHAPASRMRQLPNELISERSVQMARVVRAVQRHANCSLIGKEFETLMTEETRVSLNGRNSSYRQIVIRKEDAHSGIGVGSRHIIKITGASANVLYGTPLE